MATISRSDLVARLREKLGLTSSDANELVDVIFNEISEALVNGEEVKISGFGSFKILSKSARMGRNPKTKVPAIITARRVPSFRASNEFRSRISTVKK